MIKSIKSHGLSLKISHIKTQIHQSDTSTFSSSPETSSFSLLVIMWNLVR